MDCHKSISWWKICSNETFVTTRMIQYYKKRNGLPMLCKNKLEPDIYSCLALATVVLFKLTIIYSEPKTHFLSLSSCLILNVLSVQYSYCYHLLQFHSIDRKSETHTKVNQVPIFLMLLFLRLWWLKLPSKPQWHTLVSNQMAMRVQREPQCVTVATSSNDRTRLMTFLFWPPGLIRQSGKRQNYFVTQEENNTSLAKNYPRLLSSPRIR